MSVNKQGWCFVGTGSIATSVLQDVPWLNIVSVVSGQYENAVRFAGQHGGIACKTLDEALDVPGVTAVYIATPHVMHAEQCIRALCRKKAVFCEKPLCVNANQAEKIFTAARLNNVFFSEALWTRFMPATKEVRKWLAKGRIGEIRHITADFSINIPLEGTRFLLPEMAAGSVLDGGVYPVSFSSMVMGGEQPELVYSSAKLTEQGVDLHIASLLRYKNGVTASLHSGFDAYSPGNVLICGSKGRIVVNNINGPRAAFLYGDDGSATEFTKNDKLIGLHYEFEAVERYIAEGMLEAPEIPHEESLGIIKTIDTIRQKAGIIYPIEKEY